jgi:DHA3 family macrolide efflux protein-like MFS transporter
MPQAAVSEPASQLTFREVLRITVMRRIWYAQIISLIGDFLALFAVISVATFRMHATPSQVTGVQIAYMLPLAFLGPLSGVFVDRWPLKPTLVGSDLVRAGLVILLVLSSSLWPIYVVLVALSAVSSFFMPAQSVTIRAHVPPNGLLAANALMQMGMMGVRIIGPLAAGVLVSALGADVCYVLDGLSFVLSACLIGTVAIVRPPRLAPDPTHPQTSGTQALLRDMSQGLRFIVGHAALLFVVTAMAAGLFTIGCFGPLIAVYVRESLHGSAAVFGMVSAMVGVGMLVGTQLMRAIAARVSHDRMVLGGLSGIGAALLVLWAIPHVVATGVATFLMGFAFSGVIVPAQTLLQRETPPAMMGRISSTVMSVVIFAQLLGLLVSGAASQLLSVRAVFLMSALLSAALVFGGRLLLARNISPSPAV